MLAQGGYYQYEDDFDDNVFENLNRKRSNLAAKIGDLSESSDEEEQKKPQVQGIKILSKANEKEKP